MIVSEERVAKFVADKCGTVIVPPYTCMGTEKDGEIVNGVVFNVFTGPSIHVTVAGKKWSKGFLASVGHYVFSKLGCLRITVTTEQVEVVRIAERLGGKIEGLQRDEFGKGRDGYVVGILKDEWLFK